MRRRPIKRMGQGRKAGNEAASNDGEGNNWVEECMHACIVVATGGNYDVWCSLIIHDVWCAPVYEDLHVGPAEHGPEVQSQDALHQDHLHAWAIVLIFWGRHLENR